MSYKKMVCKVEVYICDCNDNAKPLEDTVHPLSVTQTYLSRIG